MTAPARPHAAGALADAPAPSWGSTPLEIRDLPVADQEVLHDVVGRDGSPFVSYYDSDQQVSFVWDGLCPWIAVSPGGYGELVEWAIPVEPTGQAVSLTAFANVCRAWLLTHAAHLGETW